MMCRATNAPYAPSVFTQPHGCTSAGRRKATARASTARVSRDGMGGRRGGDAHQAQAAAPSAASTASGVHARGVGQAQNQASRAPARRRATPSRARARARWSEAERVTASTNGLELLQQGLRGGRALEDRGGARDLVDGLVDGLDPAAALQLRLRLHVVLAHDALADRAQD